MAGAQLRLLDGEADVRPIRQVRSHMFGRMSDNQGDGRGIQGVCGRQDAVDERVPGDWMQDLWQLGFHSSAFAGSEDDNVEIRHVGVFYQVLARSRAS
jgi:hypothetical protein